MIRDFAILTDTMIVTSTDEPAAPVNQLIDNTVSIPVGLPQSGYALAAKIYLDNLVNVIKGQTSDFSVTIPMGCLLESVVINNNTASACQLSFGTTGGGSEVYGGFAIGSSEKIAMTVNKVFSFTADTTIYINSDNVGDTWNSCTVDFYLAIKRLI